VAALFARLDDVVYEGKSLKIEIRSTVVDDRGPGSAESIWGADFAIIAAIGALNETAEKAVLGQAKRGSLLSLSLNEVERFRTQVTKMHVLTGAIVGLEVPTIRGEVPLIRVVDMAKAYGDTWAAASFESAHRHYEKPILGERQQGPPLLVSQPMSVEDYLDAELIRCLHGDNEPTVVARMSQSSLKILRVAVQQAP